MIPANVQFLTIEGEPCPQGEMPARFTFRCVGYNRRSAVAQEARYQACHEDITCGHLLLAEGPHTLAHGIKRDGLNQNGGTAQWDWNGNREAPTLSPSVNCEMHCGWHGYIENGVILKCDKTPETT